MAGAFALLPASGDVAAATSVVNYEMNEGSNASVMRDSGPLGLDGVIGDAVVTNATYGGATGYRWSNVSPTQPPAKPERIVNVDSHSAFNPGTEDFAIEFRYRTTKSYGNIVQKGQNGAPGGYFKFEQPTGEMTCLVKDVTGKQKALRSPIKTNDGQWHKIRCEISPKLMRLYIDDVLILSSKANLASISNTKKISIGGKSDCDQIKVTCDYFTGDLDYVRFEKGGSSPPPPPPPNGGCSVALSGNTATLTWDAQGGKDVVRRNGSWLATVGKNVGTYVDSNAPAGASYIIRSWVGGTRVDTACTGSSPPPPPPPPPPNGGCSVALSGNTATLTWDAQGGTDVVRRNGSWLATVGKNVGTYVDSNAPAGASYIIRSWVGGTRVDTACSG